MEDDTLKSEQKHNKNIALIQKQYRAVSSDVVAAASRYFFRDRRRGDRGRDYTSGRTKDLSISDNMQKDYNRIAIKKQTDADPSRALAINADRVVYTLAAVRAPLTLDTAASLGRCMGHG